MESLLRSLSSKQGPTGCGNLDVRCLSPTTTMPPKIFFASPKVFPNIPFRFQFLS